MTGADGGADPGAPLGRRWDVALSFAGAQRDYVGQVAQALKGRGVRCFYDADEQVRLWGTHLAEELPRIYARESAAVVVFVRPITPGGTGPGWNAAPRSAGLWPRPGSRRRRPGSTTASCPGCCPMWLPSTCVATPQGSSLTWLWKSSPTSRSACHHHVSRRFDLGGAVRRRSGAAVSE